jgi:hypothetical protein
MIIAERDVLASSEKSATQDLDLKTWKRFCKWRKGEERKMWTNLDDEQNWFADMISIFKFHTTSLWTLNR